MVWLLFLLRGAAVAVPADELDSRQVWRLHRLKIQGNESVSTSVLRRAMVTEVRSWYAIWRPLPEFDPVAFDMDQERIRALYRSEGYYHAVVDADIEVRDGAAVVAVISVDEGPPVYIESVDVVFSGVELAPEERRELLAGLPVAEGAVFTEATYETAVAYLRGYYRERGYARVTVTRRTRVDVGRNRAAVTYRIDSGPACVFGDIGVTGTEAVDREVVRREVAFKPGKPFRASLLPQTRDNLLALKLFQTIRFHEEGDGERVNVRIHVVEQPPREIRLGGGFDTEELLRGLASWHHLNFLGGARQLGFTVRASALQVSVVAGFLQPHFPVATSRTSLVFGQGRQTEEPFTLDRTRFSPRIDWQASAALSLFVFHRFEYNAISDVEDAIIAAFPGIAPGDGPLSALGFGAEWNTTDDRMDPSRGWVTSAAVERVGGFLGGDVSFVRLTWEGRGYRHLVGRLVGAARLRLGVADPLGSSDEIPIYERFFSGGLNSVRGYGRWRVGPIIGDPVGGRSQVEYSVELRHPITKQFGAAVFVDAGQVSVRSYDLPFDDLQYGAGVGVRYKSPVGPLRLDLGFPYDPPGNDQPWRVHVSFGATF